MRICLMVGLALAASSLPAYAGALTLSADVAEYRACVLRAVEATQVVCGTPSTLVSTRDACVYSLSHVQAEVAELKGSLPAGNQAVSRLVQAEEVKARALLKRAEVRQCAAVADDRSKLPASAN